MATGHSIARARLMGAISHKRYRKFVSHEPSRATAPEGFLFSRAGFVQRSENGRPGSRGSRERSRASKSAGPAGGNGASDRGPPMAGRTNKGLLRWRAIFESATTIFVLQFLKSASVVKSADTSGAAEGFESLQIVPQCPIQVAGSALADSRIRVSKAVVKMSVTSDRAPRESAEVAGFNARRLQSRSSAQPARAATASPVPCHFRFLPVVKSSVTSGSQGRGFKSRQMKVCSAVW